MMTVFIAAVAFSLGLIAFCASVWLTTWASNCSSGQYSEMAAAKLTGYFVTVLSILSLVLTSYYGAKSLIMADSYRGMPMAQARSNQHMMRKPGVNTPTKPTTHTSTSTTSSTTN